MSTTQKSKNIFGKMIRTDHVICVEGIELHQVKTVTHVTKFDNPQELETVIEQTNRIGDEFAGQILRYDGKLLVENQSVSSLDGSSLLEFQQKWSQLWSPVHNKREDILPIAN